MGPRRCTVEGCKSVAGRQQHEGVTFHTFPNNPSIRENWITNCRFPANRVITKSILICSRHFRRVDFQPLKNNKYLLKTGAEPTIFPWTGAAKGGAIGASSVANATATKAAATVQSSAEKVANPNPPIVEDRTVKQIVVEATKPIKRSASADVVSSEPKSKIIRKSLDSAMLKSAVPKASAPNEISIQFRPGAEIEAQAFNEMWHTAKVIEVDQEDREVLIHFDSTNIKLIDEWIPMNSCRLRAVQKPSRHPDKIAPSPVVVANVVTTPAPSSATPIQQQQAAQHPQPSPLQANLPVLKKAPYNYVVGEKCMAKWTDSRRFKATVQTVLDLDYYDVLFDDGYTKRCHAKDMSKIKRKQTAAQMQSPKASSATASSSSGRKVNPPLPIPKFDLPSLNLLPVPKDGEWCCNWVNDVPIGAEGYLEGPDGSRRPTVLVEDWRLPAGWTKHLYQRSSVSGKWDVVLVGPSKKRFRSKNDVKVYLDEHGLAYNPDVYDFSIHKRRAKDLNLFVFTDEYKEAMHAKQQQLLQNIADQKLNGSLSASESLNQSNASNISAEEVFIGFPPSNTNQSPHEFIAPAAKVPSGDPPPAVADPHQLEEGYVYVGSLKVQLVDNLYRCPDATCNKHFRKENHLQIHVKHYHDDLAKLMGVCLNMSDLAYIRTTGELPMDDTLLAPVASFKGDNLGLKSKPIETVEETAKPLPPTQPSSPSGEPQIPSEPQIVAQPNVTFVKPDSPPPLRTDGPPHSDDSFHQRAHHQPRKYTRKATKGPKSRIKIKLKGHPFNAKSKNRALRAMNSQSGSMSSHSDAKNSNSYDFNDPPYRASASYEASISAATPFKSNRLRFLNHQVAAMCDTNTEQHHQQQQQQQQQPTEERQPAAVDAAPSHYIDENGEVIKLVRMRQEEIINCICDYAEEDGLMIQCELCLCWQHGFCHGIEKESSVPDKYVCYICQNPQSGRSSMKYIHDQEWLYEGRLPVAAKRPRALSLDVGDELVSSPNVPPRHTERFDRLKHSHTLTGNLLDLKRFLHSLQVKINIAENKDHPKMYLWSRRWERSPPQTSNEVRGIEPLVATVSVSVPSSADDKKIISTTELNDILHHHQQQQQDQEDDDDDDDKKMIKEELQQIATVDEVQVINDLMANEDAFKHMEKAAEEIAKSEHIKCEDEPAAADAAHTTDHHQDLSKVTLSPDVADMEGNILAGLLTSPGGTNIDLVNECKSERTPNNVRTRHLAAIIPQPEAAIDPVECQLKLLEHIQKQQMLAMTRLQSIEADIIGLEAMEEHADTIDPDDNFSSTKQSIFQLLSDLTKMRKLAAINLAEDELTNKEKIAEAAIAS